MPIAIDRIASCVIHPALGVARVGNSPDEFFYGPEAPGCRVNPGARFKDAEGRVKRQAARFRVYALDAAGAVLGELTAKDAGITWRVHVANRKAAWYAFKNAMDLGDIAETETLRNAQFAGAARRVLIIDAGAKTISGKSAAAVPLAGSFLGKPVPLGELRTDEEGRLVVLGGLGHSASSTGSLATT